MSLGLALLTAGMSVCAFEQQGQVVTVLDGDTITFRATGNSSDKSTQDIRLSQIDAPERNQPFGRQARESLSALVQGKVLRIDELGKDRQGRIMGKLRMKGVEINLEQIKRGMAWVDVKQAKDPVYAQAEEQARTAHVGLWSQPNPLPPWEYRNLEIRWRE
jgi:endonuclease YncB( thermonuclease family)